MTPKVWTALFLKRQEIQSPFLLYIYIYIYFFKHREETAINYVLARQSQELKTIKILNLHTGKRYTATSVLYKNKVPRQLFKGW